MNTEKLTETEIINKLSKQFPNDQTLGREYRKLTFAHKGKLDEFCLKYPNDFELGRFLRKKIYN